MKRLTGAIQIAGRLRDETGRLVFGPPVVQVYNPLEYAWAPHAAYLDRYGGGLREVLLVGMNPGPWGMAQTGVPFGDVAMVRDWLGITGPVDSPSSTHPKRPILGFACRRSEVSGTRLWGWARDRFETPDRFFRRFFVWNYCPLCFMEASGRNFTPDKLSRAEQQALFAACDQALAQLVQVMQPRYLIGVGKFATDRIQGVADTAACRIGRIPHPSPASPSANRDWAGSAESALIEAGVSLDLRTTRPRRRRSV
ncbi:MAG: single-stranded DNA-binding protein [Candidatus Hydrogenedentes bacterium]|nr:single-stranded DNA-binding protein [Candidatus Hydrogenedentota bacterium]